MPIATDGQGNYVTLDGDKWVPAQRARSSDGQEVVLDGGQWKPLPGSQTKQTDQQPSQAPGQGAFGGNSTIDPVSGAEIPKTTTAGTYAVDNSWTQRLGEAAVADAPSLPAVGRVAAAAGQGWRQGGFLTPEAQKAADEANNRTLLGQYVVSPLVAASNWPLRGLNALGAGLGQGAYEVGNAVGGPPMGRDAFMLNQLLSALGIARPGGPTAPTRLGPYTEPPAPPPRFVSERMAPPPTEGQTPLDRITQLIRHDDTEVAGPPRPPDNGLTPPFVPPAADASPVRGGATPQPAGAQATTAPIPAKTPAQRIADLEKTVEQTAEERAGPQLRDDTQYVPDIPPRLLAAREFRPQNSLDHKVAFGQDQVFRQDVERNARDRNQGMVDLLRRDAGDANTLDALHEARSQVSPTELRVFDGEQAVDAQGIVDKIDAILAGPGGKQRSVRNTLQDVRNSLYDANGNLETLPSQIYGARKNLTDMLQRGVKGTSDLADDVRASRRELTGLLPDFDQTITAGASRFQDYLRQWRELSVPIDQQEFLQQFQAGGTRRLVDKDGYLQPDAVQRMLDEVLRGNKATGNHKAKALTDEQIANIEAVRNELKAQSLQDRMASVKGSDTFQQAMGATQGGGNIATAIKVLGELGIGIPTGGIGNLVIHQGVLPHLQRRRDARAALEIATRKQELLSGPGPAAPP